MEDITKMSKRELTRSAICQRVLSKEINIKDASVLMNISYRHAKRIVQKYKAKGASGLAHGNRGRKSNRKMHLKIEQQIIRLYDAKYSDFRPTFFNEKLFEIHNIKTSKETVRKILIKNDRWSVKKSNRQSTCHVWREPKAHIGEMVQFDGSHHRWFEKRLDQEICLMGFTDDANSHVFAKFYEYEGTFPVLDACQTFIKKYGAPKSWYIDKHSTYKINRQATVDEQLRDSHAKTQFEQVMKDVNVEVIHAHSPQAKGRVERLFQTLQDRLVKELRLANIKTITEANKFLESYLPKFNKKFSKVAREKSSYYQGMPKNFDYKWTFSIRDSRTITNDFTIRWKNRMFLITNQTITLKNKKVQIKQALNGELRFEIKNKILQTKEITEKDYRVAKKQQKEMINILKRKDAKKAKKSWMDDFYIGNPKVELVA
ncbi:MAG: ISNCY family transposase [Nanoarchaeota archaeon]|nr:ISNCY family transposase [Nanoarchaeota archaeon]